LNHKMTFYQVVLTIMFYEIILSLIHPFVRDFIERLE